MSEMWGNKLKIDEERTARRLGEHERTTNGRYAAGFSRGCR